MTLKTLPVHPDLHLVDTRFLGHRGHVAAYLLTGDAPAILDPGASTGVSHVLDALEELGIAPDDVEYILPTHLHLDHAGAAGYLAEACSNATVIAHPMTVQYLSDPERTRRLVESAHDALGEMADGYGDLQPLPEDRFRRVEDGEILSLGEWRLRVLEATGHAPHQVCYFEERDGLLFTADEVGLWIDGRSLPVSPPPNFDFERTLRSLERFETLEPNTLLFPHFGARTDGVDGIREYRAVLDSWVETVRDALERHNDTDRVVEDIQQRRLSDYVQKWGKHYARETIKTDVRGVIRYLRDED